MLFSVADFFIYQCDGKWVRWCGRGGWRTGEITVGRSAGGVRFYDIKGISCIYGLTRREKQHGMFNISLRGGEKVLELVACQAARDENHYAMCGACEWKVGLDLDALEREITGVILRKCDASALYWNNKIQIYASKCFCTLLLGVAEKCELFRLCEPQEKQNEKLKGKQNFSSCLCFAARETLWFRVLISH